MKSVCNDVQEQIPELTAGTLPAEKAAELSRHIDACPACREHLNALQADDKLLTDFAEAMQPSVARLEEGVMGALGDERASEPVGSTSIWRTLLRGPVTRFAAAAVLLIGVGYMVGRVSTPGPLDMEETPRDERRTRPTTAGGGLLAAGLPLLHAASGTPAPQRPSAPGGEYLGGSAGGRQSARRSGRM